MIIIDNMRKILIGLIIALIILIIILSLTKKDYNAPVNAEDTSTAIFEVRSGDDPLTISQELEDNGYVQSSEYFYNLFLSNGGIIYANSYSISPSMTSQKIFQIITNPASNVDINDITSLLIYEGETIDEISDGFAQLLDVDKQDVLDYWSDEDNLNSWIKEYSVLTDEILDDDILYPLEGYLYPATYPLEETETVESLTKTILDTTEEMYSPYLEKDLPGDFTFHETLTLASIVERETMLDVDRPKVAGVFYNRMETGMPIQSDITVLYAMGEYKSLVTFEDLEYDSPYNTYLNSDLPPSPISSVSIESLEATIYPEDNNYLYFFANQDTGEVMYSETLEEHEAISEEYAWE